MAKYLIPELYKKGLSIIINSSRDNISKIIEEFKKAPKELLPNEYIDLLSNLDIWSSSESKEVIETLMSLFRLKERDRKDAKNIVLDIYETLLENQEDELIPTENFESNLYELLSTENFGLSIKAIELSSEYEKIFNDCRIITDVRFAFNTDIEDKIETGIIVHNLRIKYYQGENNSEIFLALDNLDLNDLKEQIVRAQRKEKSIKANFKDSVYFIDLSK